MTGEDAGVCDWQLDPVETKVLTATDPAIVETGPLAGHPFLQPVANSDVAFVKMKDTSYNGSWKKRGGIGAFMMLARKWDRLESMMTACAYDVFAGITAQQHLGGDDGSIIAEIRDLRRYFTLLEAEMIARKVIPMPYEGHGNVYDTVAASAGVPREQVKHDLHAANYGGPTVAGVTDHPAVQTERPPWTCGHHHASRGEAIRCQAAQEATAHRTRNDVGEWNPGDPPGHDGSANSVVVVSVGGKRRTVVHGNDPGDCGPVL